MMKCKQVQNKLNAYLDKELDSISENAIQKHLLDCHECQLELSELKALNQFINIEFEEELNPAIINGLIDKSRFFSAGKSKLKRLALSALSMCFAVMLGTYVSNVTFNQDASIQSTSNQTYYDQQSLYAVLEEVSE